MDLVDKDGYGRLIPEIRMGSSKIGEADPAR
jgi:hypothetical protein